GDHSEILMCCVGWRSRKCGARKNVPTRCTPRRMVEGVERFQPELDGVLLVIRKLESLVQSQIDRLEMRCDHRIPSDIAEGSGRGLEKRGRVVPAGRSAVGSVSIAYTCETGAIGSLIACAGIVHSADGEVLRDSALNRHAGAQIPAAKQRVAD